MRLILKLRTKCEDANLIRMSQDSVQRRAFVDALMNFRPHRSAEYRLIDVRSRTMAGKDRKR